MYAGFLSYFFIASRTLCQHWSWYAWWNACLAMRLMDNNKMWFSSRCDAAKRMFIWRSRANADIYTIVSRPKNVCPTFTSVAINSTYTTCHGAASASPFAGSLDILLRCRSIARSKKLFNPKCNRSGRIHDPVAQVRFYCSIFKTATIRRIIKWHTLLSIKRGIYRKIIAVYCSKH